MLMNSCPKVLVFAHAGIGDTVMLQPLLTELRRAWPDAHITCTAYPESREVLELRSLGLKFLPWPKNWRKDIRGLVRGLAALRSLHPDVLLVPSGMNLRLAAWAARLVRASRSIAIPPAPGTKAALEKPRLAQGIIEVLALRPELHRVRQQLRLLGALDLAESSRVPEIEPSEDQRVVVREKLRELSDMDLETEAPLAIHLGCDVALRGKAWPADRMIRASKTMQVARGIRSLLLWGPSEEREAMRVVASAGAEGSIVRQPWRTTIGETAALLSFCRVLLTNDSGVMHLAAAVGCKVLAVFGPTNPRNYGPIGDNCFALYKRVECGPCYPGPHFFDCPFDRRCLTEVPSDVVEAALLRILDGNAPEQEEEVAHGIFLLPMSSTAVFSG